MNSQPVIPQNVTVGAETFTKVIEVKWGHGTGTYSHMSGVLVRDRTQGRKWEDKWS